MQIVSLKAALTTMTKQEVFDIVVAHLLTQRERSQLHGGIYEGRCMYRSPDGALQCAVGCLISDDEYTRELDEISCLPAVVHHLVPDLGTDLGELKQNPNYALLEDLQELHDEAPVTLWESELRLTAQAHGLTFNPPV